MQRPSPEDSGKQSIEIKALWSAGALKGIAALIAAICVALTAFWDKLAKACSGFLDTLPLLAIAMWSAFVFELGPHLKPFM